MIKIVLPDLAPPTKEACYIEGFRAGYKAGIREVLRWNKETCLHRPQEYRLKRDCDVCWREKWEIEAWGKGVAVDER